MSHDSQAQLLGPLVLVNVEGMSRCQHRVFQSFEVHYRTSISIEELRATQIIYGRIIAAYFSSRP